jgi:hypothetical protein
VWRFAKPLDAMESQTRTCSTPSSTLWPLRTSKRTQTGGSFGPDRAANLLELIVLVTKEGSEMIIHAMPLRPIYRRLLER